MHRIVFHASMILAGGWSSTAWAVCEMGTPKDKVNCLVAELNVALSELGSTQDELAATRADLDGLLTYVSVDPTTDSVMFTGANVFVRSGSGATDGPVNGLGNLVVGYGEDATHDSSPDTADEDLSIWNARPHIALNRNDNVAHVVFTEADALSDELWWVRRTYTDCP